MKAYKVEILIIDHDGVGDGIQEQIENVRYPNFCINPHVMNIQEADIGEWCEDHPLNKEATWKDEYKKLFP